MSEANAEQALADLAKWVDSERAKISGEDGYNYASGEEYGLRRVQIEIERRILAALPPAQAQLAPVPAAATSPGPINCSRRLRFQGKAYPRTCERCGLGPCPFFTSDGSSRP